MLSFNQWNCALKRNLSDGCAVVVQVRALVRREQTGVCVHTSVPKFSVVYLFIFFWAKVGQSQVMVGSSFT